MSYKDFEQGDYHHVTNILRLHPFPRTTDTRIHCNPPIYPSPVKH
jgi:hypothetical protein